MCYAKKSYLDCPHTLTTLAGRKLLDGRICSCKRVITEATGKKICHYCTGEAFGVACGNDIAPYIPKPNQSPIDMGSQYALRPAAGKALPIGLDAKSLVRPRGEQGEFAVSLDQRSGTGSIKLATSTFQPERDDDCPAAPVIKNEFEEIKGEEEKQDESKEK